MMNIVFCLSGPEDFTPYYPVPVPLELADFQGKSRFHKLYSQFIEFFPEANYFAIDCGSKPSFHEIAGDIDALHLPTGNLFAKIFLFFSFCYAKNLPPFTFFYPAGTDVSDLEPLAIRIREALKQPLCASGTTFYPAVNGSYQNYIEKSQAVHSDDHFQLYGIKAFRNRWHVDKELELRPALKDNFLGPADIFSANSIRFSEMLEDNEELHTLFFMLVNSWKDGKSINTVLKEVIPVLENSSFEEMIGRTEDRFVLPVGTEYREITSLEQYLQTLPLDENRNYIRGAADLDQVTESIVVNLNSKPVRLTGLDRTMVIAKGDQFSVRKF
jgi:hypothetical protein